MCFQFSTPKYYQVTRGEVNLFCLEKNEAKNEPEEQRCIAYVSIAGNSIHHDGQFRTFFVMLPNKNGTK